MRLLDKGLPRLDMYRRKPSPPRAPARPQTPAGMMEMARLLLDEARLDRNQAAAMLAEARAVAARIVSEAQAAAGANQGASATPVEKKPSVLAIQQEVACRHGISLAQLLGTSQALHVTAARYEAIRAAAAKRPDLSCLALGRLFNRHHAIILRALKGKGGKR